MINNAEITWEQSAREWETVARQYKRKAMNWETKYFDLLAEHNAMIREIKRLYSKLEGMKNDNIK